MFQAARAGRRTPEQGPTNLGEEAQNILNILTKLCFAKNLLLPALISLLNVRKGEVQSASCHRRESERWLLQRHRDYPGPVRAADSSSLGTGVRGLLAVLHLGSPWAAPHVRMAAGFGNSDAKFSQASVSFLQISPGAAVPSASAALCSASICHLGS